MNPQDDNRDEEQIAAILKASEADAAASDPEALARLRAQSTAAFVATETAALSQSRRRAALTNMTRASWISALAAAVIVGIGLYFWLAPGESGLAFGKLLDGLENADTVHLSVNNELDGRHSEFWLTSKPRRWRMDYNNVYRIGDGSKYWIVVEKENLAQRGEPYRAMSDSLIHVLEAVGLGADPEKFLAVLPARRTQRGSADVLMYRMETKHARGVLWVEATLDSKTQRLQSLTTRHELAGITKVVGELTAIAYDEPIDAQKFVIADTLTEDGRIGKVTDVQGIVGIKPVLHERWTPVREGLVLKPGDWVRTDARGANATALRLVKNTGIILGPKTLVELIGPKHVRLFEGEIEITPTAGSEIELLGPGSQKIAVKGRKLYRVNQQQLAQVKRDPPWLLGFKGATKNESLGSLVALVDGRNVPLTVGYHKVNVDIRDQIARTVIEESFVNHTNTQLEGVFYFPLPPDASISGFGMWIGDNLVEADVVEKQRAREIYETILREKRDPGLLEWSGGNIFKARVFPIPAHAEKRIKITYTQVLPLKGNRYRYSYALQSELLQQHPLRELNIDVKVHSAVPLKSVTSPTHSTRDSLASPHAPGGEGPGVRGSRSAHLEFEAQEYTPTRDFEVVVETEGRQSEIVMIPHRRGDDGYFMLQLTPPGLAGNWDRPILPNSDPLHLLILADTSASIDPGQRATQATFIGALLASLSPQDGFNLATCDVTCDWAFARPVKADAANVGAARDFLAHRSSLGWTDLDVAVGAALKQSRVKTHVIYVGDGIVTTGDADPIAFAKRLRRLSDGLPFRPTFHAVTLGSSYESSVLKAIASVGSGSMRKISGEHGPTAVARDLLGEIAQPALRDIKVEFKGIKAARVYPETLANIPAGSQQILLGRYLPDGRDQAGEVIVTGTQGGKPVRFSTQVSLKDAELGNSFIPRLWARMHLDNLLEQGSSEAIKDEIIALSEDFQIITPYTSLLVLETDADRERFKVKRRFQMRDGERFFADGRDNAVFDLAQKQMMLAGAWRTALRRSVLSELARMGRDARVFQQRSRYKGGIGGAYSLNLVEESSLGSFPVSSPGILRLGDSEEDEYAARGEHWGFERREAGDVLEDRLVLNEKNGHEPDDDLSRGTLGPAMPASPLLPEPDGIALPGIMRVYPVGDLVIPLDETLDFRSADGDISETYFGRMRRRGPNYGEWLNTLFPPLAGARSQAKEPKSTWPAAVRTLAKSLLRTEQLAKMPGGLEIRRQTDTYDARWGDMSGRSRRLELVAAKSWLTRAESDGSQTLISWCDGKEIGVYSTAFQLGRQRAATPRDVQPPPLDLGDHSLTSLELAYPEYVPTLEPQGKDRTLMVLKYKGESIYETRILIDTGRHVILSIEDRFQGKATNTARFEDHVEAAGSWWPQRIETTAKDGKRLSLVTQTIKTLTLADVDKVMKAELSGRAQTQLLHLPLPSVKDAKKALAAGKPGFDDQFALILHFMHSQQWPRVFEHLQQARAAAPGKEGLRWLRSALLEDGRRFDDVRQRYAEDAARLAKESSADSFALAQYVVNRSNAILQANEMLTLLDALKPLYDKQPAHVHARKSWLQMRANNVSRTGRTDEALQMKKQLAIDYPRDYALQQEYVQALAAVGDYPSAYAWLTRVLGKEAKWLNYEEETLRTTYTSLLQQQGRNADLVNYLAAWVERDPSGQAAYEQYLTALIKADQIEKADALALRWLKDAQTPAEATAPMQARLDAAVNLMRGYGYQLWTNRVEERRRAPLAEAALYFATHGTHASTTEQIMNANQFTQSEEARKLRKAFGVILTNEIDKRPAEQIRRLISWVEFEDLAPPAWAKIDAKLRQRWTSEAKDDAKHELGRALVITLSRQETPNELLAFLRLQLKTGPSKHRAAYANQLFNHLLEQPWSAEFEAEAFVLLDQLSTADDAGLRLFTSVAALHRLTDALLESRITAQTKLLAHPEKLTRTELLKKQEEIRRLAREGLADRLRKDAAKQPKPLARWLIAESVYLDVLLDRNLKQVAADAWDFLGKAPANGPSGTMEQVLDEILRQRFLITLTNLAARKSPEPALVERLLKYIDQGIESGADATRWKLAKYRLLIARDRSTELEQTLIQWARQDDADSRWRIALGYLLAEQGKVPDAIRQFEAVETADELSPGDYRALAGWYLVQNQREAHERAAAAVYLTTPEYHLTQMIAAHLSPWLHGGHVPTQVDKEVPRLFAVLFARSSAPERYLGQLQQFYQASHDFRLLADLPEAVIGQTATRVYPFLQGMQAVLAEVRDEATADEIVKRIAEVRPRAKVVVDQRALDLLEASIERRAAEVQNQPGPHRDKALAALQRAFKRDWSPGEPRLMADFLAGLTATTRSAHPAFAEEQLKQLKAMHSMAAPGSIDRMHIARQRARALNGYKRIAEAIDVLQAALDEFQAAHDGVLPVEANHALEALIGFLEDAGHFARGEKMLLTQIARPVHAQQRRHLIVILDALYRRALQDNGDVSLGKGPALYRALIAKTQRDLEDSDQHHRFALLDHLRQVYHVAHGLKLPGAVADLKTFAFEIAPPLLKQQTYNREHLVSTIAQSLHDLAGPREGIAFLVNEIESEPRWLRLNNQDGWSRHGNTLAQWRVEAKELGDLDGRLLKLVLTELRRDLETREQRNRTIYHRGSERFWEQKAADFAKTAEAVLAERSKSGPAVQYIADYLYWGLGKAERAIAILHAARKQNLLDETGEAALVQFLQRENRFGESVPILLPLVERRLANLDYRVDLMHAYFRTARKAELLALLKDTDAFFHEKDRWDENPLNRLAHSTLQNELFEQSIAYFKELIPLHERSQPNRGIGNGTLANYYSGLANAYAGVNKTPEAVEAAGGAIVAWGSRRDQRARALDSLKQVLLRSPNLDAFVAHFDQQKQDSAIVRKGIGLAYREKKEYVKAIKQLEQAAQLQPNDAEVYEQLVASYDALGDKEAAIGQLLQGAQQARRDIKLYQDLGNRYLAAGQKGEAERAFTSIVEVLPNESESHALLAEVREKQNRWPEAIQHWEQVARLRALEPTGFLKLAAAQIHDKQWDSARESLRKLDSRSWPPRFGDIQKQVRALEERMTTERRK